jgi:hypothetical protein
MTLAETTECSRSQGGTVVRGCITGLIACSLATGTTGIATAATSAATRADAAAQSQGWQPEQAPVPATAAANPVVTVRQITCAAPGECVGVASFNSKSGFAVGVIEQLRGGRWTARSAPVPSGISPKQKVTLTSVSCPTPGSCGVSGFLGTPTTRRSELLTLVNGHWSAQAAPLLPGTLPDSQTLSAISCPRPGSCVAVGRYQGGAHGYFQGLIEMQSGSEWHAVEAPLPADVTRMADPFGGVDWVSCTDAGQCTTVGAYVDNQGRRELFADVLTGDHWHSSRLPVPAGAAANPLAYLGYVTCLSAFRCLAVGNVQTSAGAQRGLLEREIAGTWHAAVAPNPAGTPADVDASINEASCPTVSFCAATGNWRDNNGNNRGILETLSGGRWHAAAAPAPAGDRTNLYMESVSCPVDQWCVAAGSTNIAGLFETFAGGPWTATSAPLPANGTFAVFQSTSVACPSARMCAAFGSYLRRGPPQTQQGLLETYRA